MGCRTGNVFLKQALSALPGGLELRDHLVQPVPFLLKMTGRVGVLHRASEKGRDVVGSDDLFHIRATSAVSPSSDQAAHMPDSEGCSKPVWVEICLVQIK